MGVDTVGFKEGLDVLLLSCVLWLDSVQIVKGKGEVSTSVDFSE